MKLEFQATGTSWVIEFNSDDLQVAEKIRIRISDFEKTYSRFLDTSFISKISNITGEFELPNDAKPMFDLYFDLYKQTNGLFTPLIGQNLNEAGYDKNYSLQVKQLKTIPDLIEVVEYNFPKIKIKRPVQFDMGGIGKGYLIDIIGDLLKVENIFDFTIDAGGDILHSSLENKKIDIALEHPQDKTSAIGKISILNQSICASSSNRRNWGKYHHIIDPKMLESPTEVMATWVIADNAIIADSLATCLFLISADILKAYYNYEYLVLNSDFSISKSENFNAEIYYA